MVSVADLLNLNEAELKQCERGTDLLTSAAYATVGDDLRKMFVVTYSLYAATLQLLYMQDPKRAIAVHTLGMMLWRNHKDDPIEKETADQGPGDGASERDH